jgi:hypothetical protein
MDLRRDCLLWFGQIETSLTFEDATVKHEWMDPRMPGF